MRSNLAIPSIGGGAVFFSLACAIAALTGCATAPLAELPAPAAPAAPAPPVPPPAQRPAAPLPKASTDRVVARDQHFVVYKPRSGDTLRSLARDYLGDAERYWEIADFNGIRAVEPEQTLVIPLQASNPLGVFSGGYRTVPILAYHRFGQQPSKMEVPVASFAAQLDYLADNDYRVVRLRDLEDFLAGKRALPNRAVVITMDDGYASTYKYAFPLLKQHGFPATVFVYTDFIGAKDALSWSQMREMVASGLIDIQAHSKTHANLAYRLPAEGDERYRERLDTEARVPREVLERMLPVTVDAFAYPYGDASEILIERLRKRDYRLAVTVNPGANAFFADPLLLQRSMVLGDQDLEAFKAKLHVRRDVDLR
ncbi:MAG TPA: polysaccharide deacetylase family protein [Burkholderiales bacterium]|nr:polysaccharide deacetylase family protein [Burkholderiales bacterium]